MSGAHRILVHQAEGFSTAQQGSRIPRFQCERGRALAHSVRVLAQRQVRRCGVQGSRDAVFVYLRLIARRQAAHQFGNVLCPLVVPQRSAPPPGAVVLIALLSLRQLQAGHAEYGHVQAVKSSAPLPAAENMGYFAKHKLKTQGFCCFSRCEPLGRARFLCQALDRLPKAEHQQSLPPHPSENTGSL